MDSITQAALGAAVGGAVLGKPLGRKAIIGGALLGTLPDLDVLIDYGNAVADFTEHRGFSHSLLVLVPFSLLLAGLLHRWRPQIPLGRWWAFTGLTLVTHPLLDAFTTYGTQLFWPLGQPVAAASIFIIDPLYTLPLLLAVLCFLWRPDRRAGLMVALGLSSAYLVWSVVAQQLITQRVMPTLAEQGLEHAPRLVQPMPFSLVLWRVTVLEPDERLEIVTGFLDGNRPLHIERFALNAGLREFGKQLPDGERLEWFTHGFLSYSLQGQQLVATDIRLGVPGAHPFAFVIAEQNGRGWQPVDSYLLPEQPVNPDAWKMLWARTTGEMPVMCLGELAAVTEAELCSRTW